MIALVLALILALLSSHAHAYTSALSPSACNPEGVSDATPKVDSHSQAEMCPQCGEEKVDSVRCKKRDLKLQIAPGRFVPYGLNSRVRSDLNAVGRSNQGIDKSMRSLQKSLRDMNTSINRIRVPS